MGIAKLPMAGPGSSGQFAKANDGALYSVSHVGKLTKDPPQPVTQVKTAILPERAAPVVRRTLQGLMLRSDQTDLVFGCSHISQPVLQHMACCPQLRQLTISSAELMAVDLSSLSYLTALEVNPAPSLCN